MSRTTDEIIKPLPGQLAFRFMAEPGHGAPQATEQGSLAIVPTGAAARPTRREQESEEGPSVQTAGVRLGR
jgi:hypothetical protein